MKLLKDLFLATTCLFSFPTYPLFNDKYLRPYNIYYEAWKWLHTKNYYFWCINTNVVTVMCIRCGIAPNNIWMQEIFQLLMITIQFQPFTKINHQINISKAYVPALVILHTACSKEQLFLLPISATERRFIPSHSCFRIPHIKL